jgi:catechol 2,3-dioxygenase-like lactoylglutathione lyase family enzyme
MWQMLVPWVQDTKCRQNGRSSRMFVTDRSALHHAGVTVSDMERSLGFYRDLLGLEVMSDARLTEPFVFAIAGLQADAIRIANLGMPGSSQTLVELLEYQGVARRPAMSRPCDPGNGHLCLEVTDIESVCSRLKAAGIPMQSPRPVTIEVPSLWGAKALYVSDPDGYFVEFHQRATGVSAR